MFDIVQSLFLFSEDAFLFNPRYLKAMCICLQAVEENRVSLLAEIDAKLVIVFL